MISATPAMPRPSPLRTRARILTAIRAGAALIVSLREGGTIPTAESFLTTVCAGRPDKGMPAWCALGLEIDKIQRMYLYVKGRADGKIGPGRPAVRENS